MPTIDDYLLDEAGNAILDEAGGNILVPSLAKGRATWYDSNLLAEDGTDVTDENGFNVQVPNNVLQKALYFDGVDRGAGVNGSQAVDMGTTGAGGVAAVSGVGAAAAFTLEGKIKLGDISPTGGYIIGGRYSNGGVAGGANPVLYIINQTLRVLIRTNTGATVELIQSPAIVPLLGKFGIYDVASDYDGTTLRLYVNGLVVASQAVTGIEAPDATLPFQIGRDQDSGSAGGYPFLGYIDEVRWSNIARYAGAYTPSTTPFTTDANTLGLWHFDEGSSTIVNDASANKKNGIILGNTKPLWVDSPWFQSDEWWDSGNVVVNPTFLVDTSGWAFNDGIAPTRVADNPAGAGYSLEFADASNTLKAGASETITHPCAEGQTWTIGAWMKQTVAGTRGSMTLRAVYQDGLNTSENEFTDLVLGTWVYRSFQFTVPAGKTSFYVDIKSNNPYDNSTTGTVRVTDVLATRGGIWVPYETFNKASALSIPVSLWPNRSEAFSLALKAKDSGGGYSDYSEIYVAPGKTVSTAGAIASATAFGTANMFRTITLLPSGIASAQAFGNPNLVSSQQLVLPVAIASAEAFGTLTLFRTISVLPAGIASAQAFGAHTIFTTISVLPAGIASAQVVPNPVLVLAYFIYGAGIVSAEAFGNATVLPGPRFLSPGGIVTAEAFGAVTIFRTISVSPSGIVTAEAIGNATMVPGPTSVLPGGVASLQAFGNPIIAPTISVKPHSIDSPLRVFTSDSFNRPDGSIRNSPSDAADGGSSYAWATNTNPTDIWIVGNVLKIINTASNHIAQIDSGELDVLLECDIAGVGTNATMGLMARRGGPTFPNGYLRVDMQASGQLVVRAYDGTNTSTRWTSATGVYAVGDRISFRVIADTWEVFVNGVLVQSGTQGYALDGTKHGVRYGAGSGNAGWAMDNFKMSLYQSVGSPTILPTISVLPNGIVTAEAFGNITVVPGAVTLLVTGIASGEAFGLIVVIPPSPIWRHIGLIAKAIRLVPNYSLVLIDTEPSLVIPNNGAQMKLINTVGSIRVIEVDKQVILESDIFVTARG